MEHEGSNLKVLRESMPPAGWSQQDFAMAAVTFAAGELDSGVPSGVPTHYLEKMIEGLEPHPEIKKALSEIYRGNGLDKLLGITENPVVVDVVTRTRSTVASYENGRVFKTHIPLVQIAKVMHARFRKAAGAGPNMTTIDQDAARMMLDVLQDPEAPARHREAARKWIEKSIGI
jgi:hypothetical protein